MAGGKSLTPEERRAATAFVARIVERDFEGNVQRAAYKLGYSQSSLYSFLRNGMGGGIRLLSLVSTYSRTPIDEIVGRSTRPALDGVEAIFERVESAIDAHQTLCRVAGLAGEPEIRVSRLGVSVRIPVTLRGSRKRTPSPITGDGETVEEAADKLLAQLDHWAQAIA